MGLAMSAAVFYIMVSVFARELVNSARWKVITLAFLFTFLFMVGSGANSVPEKFLICAGICAAATAALRFWLGATWPQSLKISSSFVGFTVAWSFALAWLLAPKAP